MDHQESTETAEVAELVPKLSKEQYDMLLYFEQWYWKRGGLPTHEALKREGIELDESFYLETWSNPRFLDGLRGRGIPEHLLEVERGTFRGKILTEQQLTVANVMLDVLDKRSRLKKLTELGVSTAEYNSWLRDPVYRAYCLDRAEELLDSNQHVAHLSLIDRVSQGDLGAIKYFNSMTGRYREKVAAGVEVNVTNVTGSDMLIKVVEIIQTHVKDPATLEAIANDILALTNPTASPVGSPVGVGQNIIEGKVANYGI
jgi:hypothetical protein